MKRRLFILSLLSLSMATKTQARAIETLSRPKLVGTARHTVIGLPIFDAKLYAPDGRYSPKGSFGLELHYLRALSGRDIAKRSIVEMKNQGIAKQSQLMNWESQLLKIFPNVKAKDRILGLHQDSGTTIFYLNDKMIGRIDDPLFGQAFFAIWLGEKTTSPRLRSQLLGQA